MKLMITYYEDVDDFIDDVNDNNTDGFVHVVATSVWKKFFLLRKSFYLNSVAVY